jgi:hypothetical protein
MYLGHEREALLTDLRCKFAGGVGARAACEARKHDNDNDNYAEPGVRTSPSGSINHKSPA